MKVSKLKLKLKVPLVFVFLFGSAKIGHPAIERPSVAVSVSTRFPRDTRWGAHAEASTRSTAIWWALRLPFSSR